MKIFLLQKVRYLWKGRGLTWAVLICQRDGLSMLYVKRPASQWSDSLVVAIEGQHYFEDAPGSQFPLANGELMTIGAKLMALADEAAEPDLKEILKPEDLL
jgi:hypothetical protein